MGNTILKIQDLIRRWFVVVLLIVFFCSALYFVISASFVRGAEAAEDQQPAEDSRVIWLRTHAIPLRSIDPSNEDYMDLRPLRSALKHARVVVLGEASHGDGTTFLAKTRLVRFLHRELGFDVLAFESGLYDCWKAQSLIDAGGDPATAFRQSVFSIWTRSTQVQPLIDYFALTARSSRPIKLTGFDSQFTGELSERFLLSDLTQLAKEVGLPAEAWAARITAPLTNIVEAGYESGELPDATVQAAFYDALNELEQNLRNHGERVKDREFWLRLITSIRTLAESSWKMDFSKTLLESPEYPVRDRQMGEHLVWLARERFPRRKIVVWMHSFHAARGLNTVDVASPVHARIYRTLQPAGAVARAKLGNELYTVGVLAYQGQTVKLGAAGFPTEELQQPTAGSLEDLFHRTGLANAFLDISHPKKLPQWLRAPLTARPIGYMEMKAPWSEVYDGMLFFDRMERNVLLKRKSNQ